MPFYKYKYMYVYTHTHLHLCTYICLIFNPLERAIYN